MGDQEHVFIKLFYPASVGTVSEADLDQLLGALKKVSSIYFVAVIPRPCRYVCYVDLWVHVWVGTSIDKQKKGIGNAPRDAR